MEEKNFIYYAFISYSHQDKKIAQKLKKYLENHNLPSAVLKSNPEVPKKVSPVFIDESNLVAVGSLVESLEKYLAESKNLIVICSPNSAKSDYVNSEVEYFINNGKAGNIIPFIVDGEPHSKDPSKECFPPAILGLPKELEPLGIDVRVFGQRNAFLRVIATLLQLKIESFISIVAGETMKKMFIILSAAAGLIILLINNFDYVKKVFYSEATSLYTAYSYYGQNNYYKKAFKFYEKAADNGDIDAQVILATMYYNGEGIKQNYSKALALYEEAAENGSAEAQFFLGYMNQEGLGLSEPNYKKALECYKEAADNGHNIALINMGIMYLKGLGLSEPDYEKAVECFEWADDSYDIPDEIQYMTGTLYYKGLGVKQDYNKALEWYKRAADDGNISALIDIGNMYFSGTGVKKDIKKAVEYYKKLLKAVAKEKLLHKI